jgi:tetratricopeptide (TPR) repeat protein
VNSRHKANSVSDRATANNVLGGDHRAAPVGRGRRLTQLAVALACAAGAVWAYLAYVERPVKQAEQQLNLGNAKRSISLVDYYLVSHPQDARALAIKARALVELQRPAEAIPIFDEIGAATVADLRALARAFLLQEQWSRAQPVLEHILRLKPQDPDALHELTVSRVRMGLLEEALETAKQLTAVPGQQTRGLVMQAAITNDIGDQKQSIALYRSVLELDPDARNLQLAPEEFFLQFGSVLLNSGNPAEAIEMLERTVALRPNPTALIGIGNASSQLNQRPRALQAWQSALELDPRNRAARESLAKSALQDNDFEAAKKWLLPIQNNPDLRSSTAFLFQRVLTLAGNQEEGAKWAERAEKLRQREQTEAILDELLLRSPKSFWATVVRAHQFAQLGNWGQARDMVRELMKSEPDEPFLQKLSEAVQKRGPLPSIDELPIKKF